MRTTPADLARFLTPHADRHMVSRRTLLKAGLASTALVATTGMLSNRAIAKSGIPVPIGANPAFGGLHVYGVDPSMEPATITNFHSLVGAAGVTGSGTTVDAAVPFRLAYQTTGAHLDWSMSSGNRSFRSDPNGQTAAVAFLGAERNGTFFSSLASDEEAAED